MSGKFTKKEPKIVYYIDKGSGEWYRGPYVNKPSGHGDDHILVFKLVPEGTYTEYKKNCGNCSHGRKISDNSYRYCSHHDDTVPASEKCRDHKY